MVAATRKFARQACAVSLFFAAAALALGQQKAYEGTWQMDAAKSHVTDGRTVTLVIANVGTGVKMTMKTKKSGGAEISSEFTSKLDGKACDFAEGDHTSQLTMWFDGTALNASKEKGPAADVTSMWKFELSPDKQSMTLTINHYEPAGDDEKLIFTRS